MSKGFFKQEYWNQLPFPSPGDLPDPGNEPTSLKSPALAGRFFTTNSTWEAQPLSGDPVYEQSLSLLQGTGLPKKALVSEDWFKQALTNHFQNCLRPPGSCKTHFQHKRDPFCSHFCAFRICLPLHIKFTFENRARGETSSFPFTLRYCH